MEKTDHKWGNSWFVTNYALYQSDNSELQQSESTQNEGTQNDKAVESYQESSHIKLSNQHLQNDQQIRISNNSKVKDSLSLSVVSTTLNAYLENLKPIRKKESEKKALQQLQNEFEDCDIEKCFVYIMKVGISPNGIQPHSPLAYLATAMSQVLKTVGHVEKRQNQQTQKLRAIQQQHLIEEERREQERLHAIHKRFVEAFPTLDAQDGWIAQYARKFPMLDPKGPIVRNLAISAWWAARQMGEGEPTFKVHNHIENGLILLGRS